MQGQVIDCEAKGRVSLPWCSEPTAIERNEPGRSGTRQKTVGIEESSKAPGNVRNHDLPRCFFGKVRECGRFLPSRDFTPRAEDRRLTGIGSISNDGVLLSGILKSKHHRFLQGVCSTTHEHGETSLFGLSKFPHRIAGPLQTRKGPVGFFCVGFGKCSRPSIGTLRRKIKISG